MRFGSTKNVYVLYFTFTTRRKRRLHHALKNIFLRRILNFAKPKATRMWVKALATPRCVIKRQHLVSLSLRAYSYGYPPFSWHFSRSEMRIQFSPLKFSPLKVLSCEAREARQLMFPFHVTWTFKFLGKFVANCARVFYR